VKDHSEKRKGMFGMPAHLPLSGIPMLW